MISAYFNWRQGPFAGPPGRYRSKNPPARQQSCCGEMWTIKHLRKFLQVSHLAGEKFRFWFQIYLTWLLIFNLTYIIWVNNETKNRMIEQLSFLFHFFYEVVVLIHFVFFFRNKLKFLSFLRKRCNVNPARGPFHFRAPSRIFWKTVRGMVFCLQRNKITKDIRLFKQNCCFVFVVCLATLVT